MRRPGLLDRRPGLLVPLALVCGLGLMCALVAYGIKVNYGHEAVRFNAAAASLRDQLSRRLTAAHESIFGLAALFNASTSVNVEEFRVVGTDMLSRLDHIQSLQYMPRVNLEERQAFEQAMQEEGYLNYRIWPAKHAGPEAPAYLASQFPVRYVEPFTPSNVMELGFDILSDPALAKAVATAVDTAQVVLATRAWNSESRSLMLLKALYVGTAPPDVLAARRSQVSGLLAVRVGLHELLDTLSRLPMMHMRLTLTKDDMTVAQSLYESPPTAVPDSLFSLPSLQTQYQLHFPEHGFHLTFSQPVSWKQVWYGPVWVVLVTGLFLTGLLYITARSLVHRATDLQQRNLVIAEVVERQTAELQQDKTLLEQEVEVRRAAEQRLQQQQSALLGLATREAMVDARLDGVLGNICQAAAGTLGVDRVSIWLFNSDATELHCAALCEWGEQRHDIEAPVLRPDHADTFFAAVQGGRVIAAENARADVRTRELRHDYLDPLGISALLLAPVRRAGIIGGVVSHEHIGGQRQWFLDEQGFANSVADMVTLALEMEDRRQTESEMIKLSRALENTADSVFITDREGVIEYVNTAFVQTTGYSRDEVLGLTPRVVRSGRHPSSFYERLWRCILGGQDFREVMVNRRKDGSLYYEEKTITPLRDGRGEITHFVSTGKDITERMQTQEHLHFLAHHDVLTELPNRTLFIDRLDHAILQQRRSGRRLAVLFLDLDRFKNINDTLGHEAGDRLLQTVAARLLGCVRSVDTVARLGGDEFTLLIEDLDDSEGDSGSRSVERVAQKVLQALAEPIELYDHELYVTTSIGVAVYPTDGQDSLTLLKHADTAMYKAKENGRNTFYFYTAGMSSRAAARLTLEASLRRALERGEFVLHYQPQLDIRSGAVVAVEALIRWQKPGDGMIPPDDFIPLLEDTGLIVPVGEWVLRTACTQVRLWQSQQVTGLRMAVNLSARQFSDPDLASRIEQILGETACAPALLDLEITESVIMEQADAAVLVMQRLRSLGVRVAIDDFGTGYSSLSYLKRFPIHTLKVDRSFIRDITEDPDDAAIVQSVVAMAHALKLEVVAEGVETTHQASFLRDCQCDTVQGYLYARPMTADDLTAFIAQLPRSGSG